MKKATALFLHLKDKNNKCNSFTVFLQDSFNIVTNVWMTSIEPVGQNRQSDININMSFSLYCALLQWKKIK